MARALSLAIPADGTGYVGARAGGLLCRELLCCAETLCLMLCCNCVCHCRLRANAQSDGAAFISASALATDAAANTATPAPVHGPVRMEHAARAAVLYHRRLIQDLNRLQMRHSQAGRLKELRETWNASRAHLTALATTAAAVRPETGAPTPNAAYAAAAAAATTAVDYGRLWRAMAIDCLHAIGCPRLCDEATAVAVAAAGALSVSV